MRNIKNLVFKGGGVLGIAYAGAISAMEENQLLDDIKRVAGTSSGAIFASLLCLGYNSKEISDIAEAINFKSFGSHWNPLRLFSKYGIYRGDRFLTWIKKKIKAKTKNPDITFLELREQGYREIKLFATDLNATKVQEFSHQITPDVKLAEALRASMSVPLFFNAWQFPDGNPSNHIYIDGGTLYCYPITCFDDDLEDTLGFFLYSNQAQTADLKYGHIYKYVKLLYKAMNDSQDIDFEKDPELKRVTIQINDFGISATDLDITSEQKKKLYLSGKEATLGYINQNLV